tara:strand:+ start:10173 stop:10856 length:684 start_codon:yes stop_codon:yes gene_type:complete
MKNILCTICVRGGSKGVKNKNIKKIKGKPLIYYTLNQAKKSKLFNSIVVSSDNKKILKYSETQNISDLIDRPRVLAKDDAPKIPVIRHALKEMEKKYQKKFDIIIDLDATAPLRKVNDIHKALKKFNKEKSSNLFSVCISRRNPYFNAVEFKNGKIQPIKSLMKKIPGRQFAPKVYDMNASIYIWDRKTLLRSNTVFQKKTSIYLMSDERSLDIDNSFDFKLVEFLL